MIYKFTNRLIRFIKNPTTYLSIVKHKYKHFRNLLISKIAPYSWLDDKLWLEDFYWKRYSKKLDLRNPQSLSEKLQWIKLFDRNPLYTRVSDKYLVRQYVEEKIGRKYLVPIFGVYEKWEQINWNSIPDSFVIKMNYGCGWNIICKNKKTFDFAEAEKQVTEWANSNFYWKYREWQYKNISPRIIIEQYLEGDPQYGLLDFKVLCFSGKPKFIEVILDRFTSIHLDIYDLNWIKQPFTYLGYPNSSIELSKPENLGEILQLAERLAENLPFCRTDFYNFKDRIFFGELTLTPGAGFHIFIPDEYNLFLGSLLKLPKKKIY